MDRLRRSLSRNQFGTFGHGGAHASRRAPLGLPALNKVGATTVQQTDWPRNPIDQFILAKLQQRHWPPAAPADRETLIRRVTLDLIGLLPSPEEVHQFVNDPAPDAYEKLVDRLLASQHYGERWGDIGWTWRAMPTAVVFIMISIARGLGSIATT